MEEVIHYLRLTTGPEKVLGIPLGKQNNNGEQFWESLICKMKTKLDIWKSQDLSLERKTYLIQSLAVSQILYAIEMKHVDTKYINDINKVLWDFLWCNKRCTIDRHICLLPRQTGGLGLRQTYSVCGLTKTYPVLQPRCVSLCKCNCSINSY